MVVHIYDACIRQPADTHPRRHDIDVVHFLLQRSQIRRTYLLTDNGCLPLTGVLSERQSLPF